MVDAFTRARWNVIGTGFTRASPPQILKVDLSAEEEVASLLNQHKYAGGPHTWECLDLSHELTVLVIIDQMC